MIQTKAQIGEKEEEELMEELERLEAGEVEGELNNSQLKERLSKQRKEERQVEMLERELEELSLGGEETEASSVISKEERKEPAAKRVALR